MKRMLSCVAMLLLLVGFASACGIETPPLPIDAPQPPTLPIMACGIETPPLPIDAPQPPTLPITA